MSIAAEIRISTRPVRRTADLSLQESRISIDACDSALGWMAIAWCDELLHGVTFAHESRRNAEIALAHSLKSWKPKSTVSSIRASKVLPGWAKELVDGLQRFAEAEPVDFVDVPLATDHLTTFGRRVVAECRRIGWGQTRSYGELAALCEAPGAARAVGTVMAKNRYPLIVPCHRVLGAGGSLGGYSAPDGLRTKRRLLAMEGSLVS